MQKTAVSPQKQIDYSQVLRRFGFRFKEEELYWQVGSPLELQGWLLEISVVPQKVTDLFEKIAPLLKTYSFPFKLIKDPGIHQDSNNGMHGTQYIGKSVTLLLNNTVGGREMIEKLRLITRNYAGPEIPTDFPIGDSLYLRYGSFGMPDAVDEFGNKVALIKDGKGNVYPDFQPIPPKSPSWTTNPFEDLVVRPEKHSTPLVLGYRVIRIVTLQKHIRGNVYKAIYFNDLFLPKWCVVKEGKRGMLVDAQGRDIVDRLTWQRKMTDEIGKLVPVPAVIAEFEEGHTHFLAIKYIKSDSLATLVFRLRDKRHWRDVEKDVQLRILTLLAELLQLVWVLNKAGYFHRDINGNNFLVKKNWKIYLIDLELVFSARQNLPDPPFGKGTRGFISPQQEEELLPKATDDIFSLGATIAFFLGGMEPQFLLGGDRAQIMSRLNWLIGSHTMAEMIVAATDPRPSVRPDLASMQETIRIYSEEVRKTESPIHCTSLPVADLVKEVIESAIHTYCSPRMMQGKHWFSLVDNYQKGNSFLSGKREVQLAVHAGVGGAVYALSRLRKARPSGSLQRKLDDRITEHWLYIRERLVQQLNGIPTGLHFGTAGLAIAIAELIRNGYVSNTEFNTDLMKKCLARPVAQLDMMFGIAGEGIAMLHSYDVLDHSFTEPRLNDFIKRLSESQLASGAWQTKESAHSKGAIFPGFSNGVAGICYFLLECGQQLQDEKAFKTALKGLQYLKKAAKRAKGTYEWSVSNKDKNSGWSWSGGKAGIALCFLNAWKITGDDRLLRMAAQALRGIPERIIHQDMSFFSGLAGLGEVYLEFFQATKDQEWLDRAGWIAEFLIRVRVEDKEMSWWLLSSAQSPTIDLMTGNTGVTHFLMRYSAPGLHSFPLLPSSIKIG